MMLYPLEPIARWVIQHIATMSRRLNLGVLSLSPPREGRYLIIIGDGTPDDYAMTLVAWLSNGQETAFITKPARTGLSCLELLRTVYLRYAPHLRSVLLAVDRDNDQLTAITDKAHRKLVEHAFNIVEQRELSGGWIKLFSCTWRPGASVRVVVLVNGMAGGKEEARRQLYLRDTVEVHFLEAGKSVLGRERILEVLSGAGGDPKDAWRLLGREEQWTIFRALRDRRLLKNTFRQHHEAFRLLLEEP